MNDNYFDPQVGDLIQFKEKYTSLSGVLLDKEYALILHLDKEKDIIHIKWLNINFNIREWNKAYFTLISRGNYNPDDIKNLCKILDI